MIEMLYAFNLLLTVDIPWWTGLVLIGGPVLYVIGMIVASVFLARWFRKRLEKQENQKLEKLHLASYISWILFFILLPVVATIWYFIAPAIALLFIIPGVVFILFLTLLLIFNSKTKETIAEKFEEN
jgi:membrane protein YqaA with SNARE-associated domain